MPGHPFYQLHIGSAEAVSDDRRGIEARATADPAFGRTLRIALAMKGGVSLAVWIGGAVAELDILRRITIIGTPENPQFIARGGAPGEEELAEKIHASRGPSGENKEYLFELHQSLMELCPEEEDAHVKGLFRRVAIMEAEDRINGVESEGVHETMVCHAKPDAQEETEPEMTEDVVMG